MYICQICKKAPATIHLTDIHNNIKKEVHLCESCAAEKGFNMQTAANLPQLLGLAAKKKAELLKQPPRDAEDDMACPVCGFKWSDFRNKGRLGCPNDYVAFGARMKSLVTGQLAQTATAELDLVHVGKVPPGIHPAGDATHSALRNLDRRLKQAVAAEHYEEAARIKAEIDALKAPRKAAPDDGRR